MVNKIWQIFLITVCFISMTQALEPGDVVPDFAMPATTGAPQRLSEQIGHPVMLVWLNNCNGCREELADWQLLADSWAAEGLQTWVMWRKQKGEQAPQTSLPVLIYEASNDQAWWFEPSPAIMFIAPSGTLDYLYINNVDVRKAEIASELEQWLHNKKWFK